MKKRGLSTIVATLLIILLVLVAVGIVWGVVRNIITEGAEEVSLGKLTLSLEISNVKVTDTGVEVQVKRNPGAGEMSGIKFIIDNGEDTVVFEEEIALQELASKTFTLDYTGVVKEVSIAPVFTLESGKEKVGNIADDFERAIFRSDDGEMDSNNQGDGGDDGANKWLELDVSKISSDHSLWIYGLAISCSGARESDYRLKINDNPVLSFSWCDVHGGGPDYEWVKLDIEKGWFITGVNKINFYDSYNNLQENWYIGIDTDTDEKMSAWSSNDNPVCQPIRGTNPLRFADEGVAGTDKPLDADCYNGELMIFIG